MFSTRRNSRAYSYRTSVFLIIIAVQAVQTGCKSRAPQGRCGLPDLCSPTVMHDPFPSDQNVPPKGVDMGHYGYSRPQWRVLTSRDQFCCLVSESPCATTREISPASAMQESPALAPAPAMQQAPASTSPQAPASTSQQAPASMSQQDPASMSQQALTSALQHPPTLVQFTESVMPIVKPAEAYTPFAPGGY